MNWQSTQYNHGVDLHPWGQGGFYFDVPGSNGSVNCVIASRSAYRMNQSITIRYLVHLMSGTPQFKGFGGHVPGGLPPNFRPMLTSGDVLADRWYPSGLDCGFLQVFDHAFALTITFAPQHWQDVNGQPATKNTAAFKKVVTHAGSLAMVWGWQNYFAHGLFVVNGHARFGLWDVKIE